MNSYCRVLVSTRKNSDTSRIRYNPVKIQMLSDSLYKQLFFNKNVEIHKDKVQSSIKNLLIHGLLSKDTSTYPDVSISLPKLRGKSLEDHFYKIAFEFTLPYYQLISKVLEFNVILVPEEWKLIPGWTKYNQDGSFEKVDYPQDEVLIFDIETCVKENDLPVMATAFSGSSWYAWISPYLIEENSPKPKHDLPRTLPLESLIPLGKTLDKPRIAIGHNVAFDRSYIKEQYDIKTGFMYFLDTLSLHSVVAGFALEQKSQARSAGMIDSNYKDSLKKMFGNYDEEGSNKSNVAWTEYGAFNSLVELAKLYTGENVDKTKRGVFITGNLVQIKKNYKELLTYCANDVVITTNVFKKLWLQFVEHSSHPVSLSGFLIMSTCILPVNQTWKRYIKNSEASYEDAESEISRVMLKLSSALPGQYMSSKSMNPWLNDLDWSVNRCTINPVIAEKYMNPVKPIDIETQKIARKKEKDVIELIKNNFDDLKQIKIENWYPDLPSKTEILNNPEENFVGYPHWYIELLKTSINKGFGPVPSTVDISHRLSPIVMRLSWKLWPLHHHHTLGWGYLLPTKLLNDSIINIHGKYIKSPQDIHPYRIVNLNEQSCEDKPHWFRIPRSLDGLSITQDGKLNMQPFEDDVATKDAILEDLFGINIFPEPDSEQYVQMDRPYIPNKASMYPFKDDKLFKVFSIGNSSDSVYVPIPHPLGEDKPCGNPLGSEYYEYFMNGTLIPLAGEEAMRIIQLNNAITFWRNNRRRISHQLTVFFEKNELPYKIKNLKDSDFGFIVPRIIVAGTVTRRAVEVTWLTATNPQKHIVGTELKSAVEAPVGYCFVGADVDSEELWIASLIGDAAVGGFHGSTPFSYMNIQGTKDKGTDLHSVTAKAIGVSRDQAKVLNYGRLYGAGLNYVARSLKEFQPQLTDEMSLIRAIYLYNFTKGLLRCELTKDGIDIALKNNIKFDSNNVCSMDDFEKMLKKEKIPTSKKKKYGYRCWQGGSESEVFNILERLACDKHPKTPVLEVGISKALTPDKVGDDYLTSRMNWVIQSSAVDFLHLLLVCVFWLFSLLKIPARLCICVHDEVRFLVPEMQKYEAALVLHLSNLYTRASFSQKLGINDLPQRVAFFSSVDVDYVLRKETSYSCQTPSNPLGCPFKGESLDIHEVLQKIDPDIFLKLNEKKNDISVDSEINYDNMLDLVDLIKKYNESKSFVNEPTKKVRKPINKKE